MQEIGLVKQDGLATVHHSQKSLCSTDDIIKVCKKSRFRVCASGIAGVTKLSMLRTHLCAAQRTLKRKTMRTVSLLAGIASALGMGEMLAERSSGLEQRYKRHHYSKHGRAFTKGKRHRSQKIRSNRRKKKS